MRFARNLVAGLAGSAWVAVVGLAATPFLVALLGIEGYGLIGFFMTLQALMSVLDAGLSPTMNRDVARGLAVSDAAPARALLASLARVYWGTALLAAVVFVVAAPAIAGRWLRAGTLDEAALAQAVMLMGLAIAARWPAGVFLAAVNGAQRIALGSGLTAAYATVSAFGAVALLALGPTTLTAYFAWQMFAALAYTLALQAAAWSALGGRQGAAAGLASLRRVWRFSAATGLIAVSGVVLTQVDKALLSRLLALEDFGRYMLAAVVAGSLYLLVRPVFDVLYPRFSALVAARDEARLAELYHLATRVIAVLVFPPAMVLVVFGGRIVGLWTGDAALGLAVAPIVALLAAGSALHAVMYAPYALQLASGAPRLPLLINAVLVTLAVPLVIVLAQAHGGRGAAFAWLLLHTVYLLFGTWVTHRRLLRGEGLRWLAVDVGIPLGLTLAAAAAAWGTDLQASPAWPVWAVATGGLLAGACLLVSPGLRSALRRQVASLTPQRSSD